jgi:hypothetical protein
VSTGIATRFGKVYFIERGFTILALTWRGIVYIRYARLMLGMCYAFRKLSHRLSRLVLHRY